jgi:hypothetical protein
MQPVFIGVYQKGLNRKKKAEENLDRRKGMKEIMLGTTPTSNHVKIDGENTFMRKK